MCMGFLDRASLEGTLVRKFSNKFGISLTYSYFELRSKIGCISEMKINQDLFCISLDLHYLCRRMSGKN